MLRTKDVTEDHIWLRAVCPDEKPLTPEKAKAVLGMKLSNDDLRYMKRLAQRSREGRLTEEQRKHVDIYARISTLLAILHAEARVSLGHPASLKPTRRP